MCSNESESYTFDDLEFYSIEGEYCCLSEINTYSQMIGLEELTDTLEVQFSEAILQLSKRANDMAHKKGFYEGGKPLTTAIALQHSELSEVLEALREGNLESTKIEGYSELEEEYADVLIRILDTAGEHDLDIGGAVIAKMRKNSDRDHKHGKEF